MIDRDMQIADKKMPKKENRLETMSRDELFDAELKRLKGMQGEKLLSPDIYKDVVEKVKKVPISQIILSRIPANSRGECLCPFHNDQHTGSFKYKDESNIFNCFTCHEQGDGISFVQKMEDKNYKEAIYEIAAQFKLIPEPIYEELSGEKLNVEVKDYTSANLINPTERLRNSADVTDFFFRTIMKSAILSNQHHSYLTNRGISEEEIKEVGYFTLFKDKSIQEKAINTQSFKDELNVVLKNAGYAANSYKNVRIPGVYYEDGEFKLTEQQGLVIPIKDIKGKIQALQIRRDFVREGESRYLWVTSTNHELGATPGTPIDVYIPKKADGSPIEGYQSLILSEGHFKIRRLGKASDFPAFSFQGIQNIQELDKNLKELHDLSLESNFDINAIRIFYDMDMYKNLNVYNAMLKLINELKEDKSYINDMVNFYVSKDTGKIETMPTSATNLESKYDIKKNILVQFWDPRIGKGADDFLDNGGLRFMSMNYEDFIDRFENSYLQDERAKEYFKLRDELAQARTDGKSEDEIKDLENKVQDADSEAELAFIENFIENPVGYISPEDALRDELRDLDIDV